MRTISIGGLFNAQIQEARYHIGSVSILVVLQHKKWKWKKWLSLAHYVPTAIR